MSDDLTERLCEEMHDRYEAAAIEAGWATSPRSRVPWADVPEANKATMRAAVAPIAARIDELKTALMLEKAKVERVKNIPIPDVLRTGLDAGRTHWLEAAADIEAAIAAALEATDE